MEPGGVEHTGFRYQPALDGLRAIAVLAVLGYHYGAGDGGFLGVDIFLVLSGYLITSLLAIELSTTGHIAFLKFWGRRVRRLLPALLVLLIIVGLYAVFAAPSEQLARTRSDGLATLFYVQNWHMIRAGAQASPLSHTWSLAIEEQWYLIWPPVFLALSWLCRGRRRLLIGIVVALALVSAAEMAHFGPSLRAYYGTDSRAQALLLGAALALVLQLTPGPRRRALRVGLELAGIAGLLAVAFMAVQVPSWMYRGGFLFVAVAVACGIAAAVQRDSPVLGPVLSIAPLRWLGLISYGVYLYHFPVLRWLNESRTGLPVIPLTLLRFTVTIAIATASFVLIERPVRHGTFLSRRAQLIASPFVVAAVAILLVVTTVGSPSAALSPTSLEWTYAKGTTPAGAQRVVLVGDRDVVDLTLTMHGAFDAPGVRGLSIGTPMCRLEDLVPAHTVAVEPGCSTWWNQVRDALGAYKPATVVLQFDANELAGPAGAPKERSLRIQAALDEIRAMIRRRADVVLLSSGCPPSTATSTAGDPTWLARVWQQAAAKDANRVHALRYPASLCGGTLTGEQLRTPQGGLTAAGARSIWRWLTANLPQVR